MEITIKPAFRERKAIQELLVEYTSMVVAEDPRYEDFLALQRFEAEVAHPERKYCRLYLVSAGPQQGPRCYYARNTLQLHPKDIAHQRYRHP
ncbi:MAG: hypothetical protein IKB65_08540 [Ruminiclostridium sp.]|nr:hypothetical protein [Ruminiclostridium sp.]